MAAKGLYLLPMNVNTWRDITGHVSLEEEAALLRACLMAWTAPQRDHPPATLIDDDDTWERLFGRRFSRVEPIIRQHFHPVSEQPGYLLCSWLLEWYETALAKYNARVTAGRIGGSKGRGGRRKRAPDLFEGNSTANSKEIAQLIANPIAIEVKRCVTPHTGADASNARPDDQQRSLDELEAWAANDRRHAIAVETELAQLCATFPADQRADAARTYRPRALRMAFTSLTSREIEP